MSVSGIVEGKSHYGVLVNGEWYNPDKKSGPALSMFEVGKAYVLDIKENTFKGKTYKNIVKATVSETPKVAEEPKSQPSAASIPQTAIEKPAKRSAKAVAFGRELSDYELQKDRRIGVAGVVQAVIGSDWYAQQAALTDLSNKDSVKALRDTATEEVTYWLSVIQAKSEAQS